MSEHHEVSFRKPRQVSVIATASWEQGPLAVRGLLSSLEGGDIVARIYRASCGLAEKANPKRAASQHLAGLHTLRSPLPLAGWHEASESIRR